MSLYLYEHRRLSEPVCSIYLVCGWELLTSNTPVTIPPFATTLQWHRGFIRDYRHVNERKHNAWWMNNMALTTSVPVAFTCGHGVNLHWLKILFRSAMPAWLCQPLKVLWSVIHPLTQWSRLHALHVITSATPKLSTFIVALNMVGSRPLTRIPHWLTDCTLSYIPWYSAQVKWTIITVVFPVSQATLSKSPPTQPLLMAFERN